MPAGPSSSLEPLTLSLADALRRALSGVMFLLLVPLVFIMRRPKRASSGMAAAH